MDKTKDGTVSAYIALVDGKPGAFGVIFPDCPGLYGNRAHGRGSCR
jgi:hypothetical protein